MKLDQLPIEMLMHIVSYVPTCDEIYLVNKLFNSIAQKVDDSNICLRIDWRFFYRLVTSGVPSPKWLWFSSIGKMYRQISNIQIHCLGATLPDGDERQIISVVKMFSETIKSLQLANVSMSESDFLGILSLLPNLEHLDIRGIDCMLRSPKRQRSNSELTLNRLKSLTIHLCGDPDPVFSRLSLGVLTYLEITRHWKTLTMLNPLSIKKLKWMQVLFDAEVIQIFNKLKLDSLELNFMNISSVTIVPTIEAILSEQGELKSLTLSDMPVFNDQVANAIRRLKKLQEFNLLCYSIESTALMTLVESKNASIEKFSLSCASELSVDLIASLGKFTSNIKYFELESLIRNPVNQDAILRHFNSADVLKSLIIFETFHDIGDYFNPRLKELGIVSMINPPCFKTRLTKWSALYPNVRKLRFTSNYTDGILEIQTILDSFTKLECLIMDRILPATINHLCKHKGHLKFVSWKYKKTPIDEIVKKLRTSFGLVYVDRDRTTVYAAVDRYTMNCERLACRHF